MLTTNTISPFDFKFKIKSGSDNSLPHFIKEYLSSNEFSRLLSPSKDWLRFEGAPLIRDLKELILWKIIDGMMIDISTRKKLHHQYIRRYSKSDPLYAKLREFITQKRVVILFASIAKRSLMISKHMKR
ncbi:hypothetical protein H5410_064219 [Solanum commersonii]|uniref:Uncharacterized protein n=1 Tax=Solanum commersonii TaxID=4109 RepID=A0A9J5VZX9_SOLCO|nr:hypothetical protein H5410_064219 [Solanum commersonii]